MNALTPIRETYREDPALLSLRDALGAVAIAPALAYSLSRSGSHWRLRRLDERHAQQFDSREAALAAMRRAVVRCSAYCLFVEDWTGDFEVQSWNWDDRAAAKFGVRP